MNTPPATSANANNIETSVMPTAIYENHRVEAPGFHFFLGGKIGIFTDAGSSESGL